MDDGGAQTSKYVLSHIRYAAPWENDGSSGHILKHVQLIFSNMYKRFIHLLNSSIIDESLIDFSRENALTCLATAHRRQRRSNMELVVRRECRRGQTPRWPPCSMGRACAGRIPFLVPPRRHHELGATKAQQRNDHGPWPRWAIKEDLLQKRRQLEKLIRRNATACT
jgi:hypothetical protein